MLKEFSITTTITVSNSVFIGAVFQFEVSAALVTRKFKKKVYEASLQSTSNSSSSYELTFLKRPKE